ncbi:hypothetical protein Sjap_019370 [Stephania japonica]|uniref:Uncharacterized protein n=1 Tax=Stephania japonica TaxID=461633 RepID=A0AAP0EZY4_9MAGN
MPRITGGGADEAPVKAEILLRIQYENRNNAENEHVERFIAYIFPVLIIFVASTITVHVHGALKDIAILASIGVLLLPVLRFLNGYRNDNCFITTLYFVILVVIVAIFAAVFALLFLRYFNVVDKHYDPATAAAADANKVPYADANQTHFANVDANSDANQTHCANVDANHTNNADVDANQHVGKNRSEKVNLFGCY